jgi:GNAT superfamily N-acetyltransferase
MLPLWRVTRNRFGKRLHARLDDLGVTVSRLYEYRADLPTDDAAPPAGVDIGPTDPAALPDGVPVEELVDAETVLTAVDGDALAGYLFLSAGATVPVPELGREMTFDGGYVRRLYVDRDHRQRGIASALVAAANAAAADHGADTAAALIAVDNRPSQWTFESRGYERVARHAYDRLGPLVRRRRRPVTAESPSPP